MGMGGTGGPTGERRRRLVAAVVVVLLVLGIAAVLIATLSL
jgi:hypothetical protein